ncbi:DM13 domain-containing protein [Maribius pontilimi]|uniref:DM13 domain-containing protein n=1 Tax=Palleronia pontilimi TaxID=1964209 RepID=A0A934IE67_9RHOB|nr:DM13 domain-containing protein [Palleronia pontilimi]MBJ3761532.1 DM13 domain-containing protein [Palleronia pontilimi]
MPTRRSFLTAAAGLAAAIPFASFAQSVKSGTFVGASGHTSSGGVALSGDTVSLLDDFRLDRAPDPKVAPGRDGYDPATLMGPRASRRGASSYALPAGIDAADYNEVWIWCEEFNVPLAVAKLS